MLVFNLEVSISDPQYDTLLYEHLSEKQYCSDVQLFYTKNGFSIKFIASGFNWFCELNSIKKDVISIVPSKKIISILKVN